jgi:hypothetical protein
MKTPPLAGKGRFDFFSQCATKKPGMRKLAATISKPGRAKRSKRMSEKGDSGMVEVWNVNATPPT